MGRTNTVLSFMSHWHICIIMFVNRKNIEGLNNGDFKIIIAAIRLNDIQCIHINIIRVYTFYHIIVYRSAFKEYCMCIHSQFSEDYILTLLHVDIVCFK